MKKSTKRTISIYLKGHLVLMLIVSFLIWFPVFFVLYGGIQATALLYYLKRKTSGEITVPARRVIYLFSLLQIVYTIALLYVGVYLICDVNGIRLLPRDSLKGTLFTNPEFFHVMPGVYLNALYLPLAIIWLMVYAIRRNFVKVSKD